MEIGVYTFVEVTPNPITGELINAGQRIRNLMEEVVLSEQVGLDVFAIGEHHRPDFAASLFDARRTVRRVGALWRDRDRSYRRAVVPP